MALVSNSNLLDVVKTRASLFNKDKVKNFKATVFEDYKPKLKTDKNEIIKPERNKTNFDNSKDSSIDKFDPFSEVETRNNRIQKNNSNEFDIKKAKHEVMNFAISSSSQQDKKTAQIALAIKLGAKPQKRQFKNYKELLQEKKCKKEEDEKIGKLLLLGKNQYGASITRCSKKKPRKIVSQISKHYGVANPNLKKRK